MLFNYTLGNGQPEAGAFPVFYKGSIYVEEGLKYPFLVFKFDADTLVNHPELTLGSLPDGFNLYFGIIWAELGGIAQQVKKHLLELAFISIGAGQLSIDSDV